MCWGVLGEREDDLGRGLKKRRKMMRMIIIIVVRVVVTVNGSDDGLMDCFLIVVALRKSCEGLVTKIGRRRRGM